MQVQPVVSVKNEVAEFRVAFSWKNQLMDANPLFSGFNTTLDTYRNEIDIAIHVRSFEF